MTDSEYVLALDGTIGLSNSSLLIKAHRERLRSIAARLATHPLAAAVLQQEAGEPVAFMWQHDETGRTGFVAADFDRAHWAIHNPRLHIVSPLYTTPQVSPPQARVPLTEEQANEVWRSWVSADNAPCDWCSLLRLTERAHGIGLETKE